MAVVTARCALLWGAGGTGVPQQACCEGALWFAKGCHIVGWWRDGRGQDNTLCTRSQTCRWRIVCRLAVLYMSPVAIG